MPNPNDFDDMDSWMNACMMVKDEEGVDHEQAVAECLSMWDNKEND